MRGSFSAGQTVERSRRDLEVLAAKLDALSPLTTLARGYAICTDSSGRVLTDYTEVNQGAEVAVQLKRGVLTCSVLKGEDK